MKVVGSLIVLALIGLASGQTSIFGRLICTTGTPNACGNTVSVIADIVAADTFATFNQNRTEFLLAYTASATAGGQQSLLNRRISSAGAVVSGPLQILSFAQDSGNKNRPVLARDEVHQNYVLAFEFNVNEEPAQDFPDVATFFLANDGVSTSGITFQFVSNNAQATNVGIQLFYNPTANNYLTVWSQEQGNAKIATRLLDVNGVALGNPAIFTVANKNIHRVAAVFIPNKNQYLFVYESSDFPKTTSVDIHAAFVAADGSFDPTSAVVLATNIGTDGNMRVALDQTGNGFIVSYSTKEKNLLVANIIALDSTLKIIQRTAVGDTASNNRIFTLLSDASRSQISVIYVTENSNAKDFSQLRASVLVLPALAGKNDFRIDISANTRKSGVGAALNPNTGEIFVAYSNTVSDPIPPPGPTPAPTGNDPNKVTGGGNFVESSWKLVVVVLALMQIFMW